MTVGSNPTCIQITGYAATFSKQADNGMTCTITSVVYAKYVDSTVRFFFKVLLSAVTVIQYSKIRLCGGTSQLT